MKRHFKLLLAAIVLGILGVVLAFSIVAAIELTPPYVIAIQDTGVSSHPERVAVDPIRGYGYVLDQLGQLWIFEGTEITQSLNIGTPSFIGVDPGGYAYITSETGDPVRVVNGLALAGQVDLGKSSGAVAVLTTTHRAFVALPNDDQVVILNGTTIVDYVAVGSSPKAIAANPATNLVYVANSGDDTVSIINGTTLAVQNINVQSRPAAIAINPKNGYIYISNGGSNTVSILQQTTLVATVPVGVEPGDIAVNSSNGRAYVVNNGDIYDAGSVSVLQDAQAAPVTETAVGTNPRAVDVNPATGYIYVVSGRGAGGTVAVMSDTLVIETFLPVGHSPRDIAVDPVSDLGYASLYKSSGGLQVGQVVILGRTEAATTPLDPPNPTDLECVGLNDKPLHIHVPANAVTESLTLLCAAWAPDVRPTHQFGGQGFLLKVYKLGVHRPGFEFLIPITVDAEYQVPLPPDIEEEELLLIMGASGEGSWSQEGIVSQQLLMATNTLSVEIIKLPSRSQDGYALAVPAGSDLYLPLVMR
ncbi:MAG: hypothetical protein JXB35_08660 [Anaerolineae bacterium]|nr:hypothetical protein [Anaerolineae bacterium]